MKMMFFLCKGDIRETSQVCCVQGLLFAFADSPASSSFCQVVNPAVQRVDAETGLLVHFMWLCPGKLRSVCCSAGSVQRPVWHVGPRIRDASLPLLLMAVHLKETCPGPDCLGRGVR